MIFRARPLLPMRYALSFDGNDYVNCGANAAFNIRKNLTLEAWIKTTTALEENIISRDSATERLFAFRVYNNKLRFVAFVSDTYYYHDGTTVVNDGEWHHVAMVYNGTTVQFYVDGEDGGSVAETRNIDTNSGVDLVFGYEQNGKRYFNGQMRNVRIWNVARTQSQIQQYKNANVVGQTGLVGYWPFKEGSGSILSDLSGNGFDGTITGATWVKL